MSWLLQIMQQWVKWHGVALRDIGFISFGYVPRSSIAESYGSSIFILGILAQFSIATTPVYIPTNNTQAFPFLHTFAKFIPGLFDNNHSSRYEMTTSHLYFYFPNNLWCWAPFSVPVGHFTSSLNEHLFHLFLIFKSGYLFSCYWLKLLRYFGY